MEGGCCLSRNRPQRPDAGGPLEPAAAQRSPRTYYSPRAKPPCNGSVGHTGPQGCLIHFSGPADGWAVGDPWNPGLRFETQRRLCECVKLRDRSARNPEDLPTATPKGGPGFKRGNALDAEALDQRVWQIGWQCVRHVGQSSKFGWFAKRNLTICGASS